MNYRNYKINVRLLNDTEMRVKVYNAGGPISALMLFLNENQIEQTDMIVSVNILDVDNNRIVEVSNFNNQLNALQ